MNDRDKHISQEIIQMCLVTSICILLTAALTNTAHAATWYVLGPGASLNQSQGPIGSRNNPLRSLAEVEDLSGPGDKILVLPSLFVLDGGIQLKIGQKLLGLGQGEDRPTLTNTSNYLDGDAGRTRSSMGRTRPRSSTRCCAKGRSRKRRSVRPVRSISYLTWALSCPCEGHSGGDDAGRCGVGLC